MGSKVYYRQCIYEQAFPPGNRTKFDVAWIPEELAKVSKIVYFGTKREDIPREDFYKITMVGDNRRSAEWLHFKTGADRAQREASDV